MTIGSLVINLLASLVTSSRWLERLSLFHYMALAPAQPVDATTVLILLAIAFALCVVATIQFSRRGIGAA